MRYGDAEYKNKSLDGTKPNTNPKTNPNPNTNPIQLFYAFSRITIPQNTRRILSAFRILQPPHYRVYSNYIAYKQSTTFWLVTNIDDHHRHISYL